MVDRKNVEETTLQDFLTELREFAITVGEDCPEGHRREPGSDRCLPIGSTDHTAFTRSVNNDDGPEWRGLVDKTSMTFDQASLKALAIDADEMDEPESCAHGTTFSFIKRKCISLEEADVENSDEYAMINDTEYLEVEVSSGDGKGGHKEITLMQPEGRRDTVNFQCPPNQFFDFKLRQCIPLNKDTVMASESLTEEETKELASHLHGKIAMTSPDPLDGHQHLVTVDMEGSGKTSVCNSYVDGKDRMHSHDVSGYMVADFTDGDYTSRHFGYVLPKSVYEYEDDKDDYPMSVGSENTETAAPISSKQRKGLPDSSFGVPGKRKFPLDTCARVRNAMARFNQAKGLTSGEKATLRRKILARAKACNIEVKNFAKANSADEFAAVYAELLRPFQKATEVRMASYRAEGEKNSRGPCPPGMEWDSKAKKCNKMRGFYEAVKDQANHAEIIAKQPAGRRDTVNHACPPGHLFDYKNRKCIPMDTRNNPGQPGDTTKASEEGAQRDLSPSPKGKPARLPEDCPAGTIWDGDRQICKPLDSRKKTKSSEAEAQTTSNGPGNKGGPGCPDGQFMNPITKKCMPRKGAFKGKSGEENAENAMPGNREGLVGAPAGKVKHPTDCPAGTLWDGKNKICRPLDSMDKSRPSGSSPQNPADTASVEDVVEGMSLAKIISHLDEIIREEVVDSRKEKAKVAAKDLPNEAFPPSLVGSTRRSLMHHSPEVTDPYDTETVDVGRLRNALARVSNISGYADKAVEDARDHLLFHARSIVSERLGKR